jgi:hypothetical protein
VVGVTPTLDVKLAAERLLASQHPRALVCSGGVKETSFLGHGIRWLCASALTCSTVLFAAEVAAPVARTNVAGISTNLATASTNTVPTEADKEKALLEQFKKEENTTNSLGSILVWVPAGYRVGQCEVTQAEFQQVMGTNPSKFSGPQHPAEQVSWTEAQEFCRKLTEQERQEGKVPKTYAYALPNEEQWDSYVEGTLLKDAITSYLGDRRNPENVGGLPTNKFGLHDVRGNVWEWCSTPVARGGSWRSYEDFLSPAMRFVGTPDLRYDDIGFRVILQSTEP